jgi:tetratricopeptide (TPR) repeat protein
MGRDRLRRTLFKRVQRADDADLPALTARRARDFLAVFPTYGPAWYRLGQALTRLACYAEAEQALRQAICFCPSAKLHMCYTGIGQVFRGSGDDSQAEAWFRRAIDAAPDDAQGYLYLGGLLASRGRLGEAEEVHRKGAGCSDGCVDESFLNLGLVLRAQGRFGEAAECFAEAIRRDPGYRDAKVALRDVRACEQEEEMSVHHDPHRAAPDRDA